MDIKISKKIRNKFETTLYETSKKMVKSVYFYAVVLLLEWLNHAGLNGAWVLPVLRV